MSYDGWIEVALTLTTAGRIQVPFLVTPDNLTEPMIGRNVIEETIASLTPNKQVNDVTGAAFCTLQPGRCQN